jgi:two-component system nitrogen regulation sensor histidine kinase NtrY
MISRNLYFNIVFRILLIVALSIILGYVVVKGQHFRIFLICMVLVIILTVNLITYLNTTNRKIGYFFGAVKNEESNLRFPIESNNRNIKEIYRGMNRVNQQIQELKIEISQQEQFFKILLEHLATGILTYNKKGFIHHANSAAKRLLSMEVLTHLQQIERVDQKLYQAISGIKPFERKLVAVNLGQDEIQLSLKATSFRADATEMIILSIQDIKNELEEKELESWMKLIRVLIHEIMNSITPITSLSESLTHIYRPVDRPVSPQQITESTISKTIQGLDVIKKQGKGLMSFVESYRKLTKIPKPEKKLFMASEFISRVQTLVNSLENSDKVKIDFQLTNPDLEIFADEDLISQVLINLIKNALEANETNPDGKIKVIAGTYKNRNPEICIIDNGPGIIAEHLETIFVPFFTTREKGSGIGLSISRQIMSAHGGVLKVRSIPGKETVFCMSFPG